MQPHGQASLHPLSNVTAQNEMAGDLKSHTCEQKPNPRQSQSRAQRPPDPIHSFQLPMVAFPQQLGLRVEVCLWRRYRQACGDVKGLGVVRKSLYCITCVKMTTNQHSNKQWVVAEHVRLVHAHCCFRLHIATSIASEKPGKTKVLR